MDENLINQTTEEYDITPEEEIVVDISESMGWVSGDERYHSSLLGTNEPNQHKIIAIEGLREELDEIEALKSVYSDAVNVANYYKWADNNVPVERGYFVSFVPGSSEIKVCDGSDIFGVSVDAAGFIGNEGYEEIKNNDGVVIRKKRQSRSNEYGLVVTSGIVEVLCTESVAVGDYVVSNEYGIAIKTESGCGYKVIALKEKVHENDIPYAIIALGVQACTTDAIGTKVQRLESDVTSVKTSISQMSDRIAIVDSAINDIKDYSDQARKDADDALGRADDAYSKADGAETAAGTAQTLASQAQAEAATLRTEAVNAANLALAGATSAEEKVVELIANVDKYSVGEHSQSYGLTVNLARDILTEGMIYIPIGDNIKEQYVFEYNITIDEDGNKTCDRKTFIKEFTQGNYYEWKNNISLQIEGVDASGFWWNEYQGKVWYLGTEPDFTLYDYWFPNVLDVADGYKSQTLYVKKETGDAEAPYKWSEEACLVGNANNRLVGLLRGDTNSIGLELSNARGDAATLGARLDADGARTSLTATKVTEVKGVKLEAAVKPGDYADVNSLTNIDDPVNADGVYYIAGTTIPYDVYSWNGTEFVKDELLYHDGINFCKVNSAALILAVNNDGETSAMLNANKINFEAGTFEINASDIKFDCAEDYTIGAGHVSFSTDDFKIYPIDKDGNPETDKDPNFSVAENGDVTIKGNVYANAGEIAGWEIGSDRISKDKTGIYTGMGYRRIPGTEDIEVVGPYTTLEELNDAVDAETVKPNGNYYYLIGYAPPYELYVYDGVEFMKSNKVVYEEDNEFLFKSLIDDDLKSPVRFYAGKSDLHSEVTKQEILGFTTESLEELEQTIDMNNFDAVYYEYTDASVSTTKKEHEGVAYTKTISVTSGSTLINGSETNYSITPLELSGFLPADLTKEQITSLTHKLHDDGDIDVAGIHLEYIGNGSVILDGYMSTANTTVEVDVVAVFNYSEDIEAKVNIADGAKQIKVTFTPKLKGVDYEIRVDYTMKLVAEAGYQFKVLEDGSMFAGNVMLTGGKIGGWTISEDGIHKGDDNGNSLVGIHSGDISHASLVDGNDESAIRFFAGQTNEHKVETLNFTSTGETLTRTVALTEEEQTSGNKILEAKCLTTEYHYEGKFIETVNFDIRDFSSNPDETGNLVAVKTISLFTGWKIIPSYTVSKGVQSPTTVANVELIDIGDGQAQVIATCELACAVSIDLHVSYVLDETLDVDVGISDDGTSVDVIFNPQTVGVEYSIDIDCCIALGEYSFKVLEDGSLYASDVDIKGNIRATSGYIGDDLSGFTINSSHIANGKTSYSETVNDGVYLGTDGIGLGKGKFYVNDSGEMHSESGVIGSWKITSTALENYSGAKDSDGYYPNSFCMQTAGDGAVNALAIGKANEDTWGQAAFRVTVDGEVYASQAHITGGTLSLTAEDTNNSDVTNTYYHQLVFDSAHGGLRVGATEPVTVTHGTTPNTTAYPVIQLMGGGMLFNYCLSADDLLNGGTKYTKHALINKGDYISMGGTWSEEDIVSSLSDASRKHDIELLDDRYDVFFDNLTSRRFKYNHGTSDRYHSGYITQEIQAALRKAGIDEKEFAAICTFNKGTDEEYSSLRYPEFISLNTWQIQKLKARVIELEEKNAELEERLNKIEASLDASNNTK